MKTRKLTAIVAVVAAALAATACGGKADAEAKAAKPVVIRMSHTQAPNSVSDMAAKKFAELVAARSDGKIKIEVYSNCGLSGGDLTKALEMVQTGDIDIHSCAPTNAANFDKRFYIFWMPFLFPTTDSLLKTCSTPAVLQEVDSWCAKLNMSLLGVSNAGSRQLSNGKKEIRTPANLAGLNIRVPGASLFIDLYRDYFKTNPTAMDFSEVYTALQQGTIDGQENPVSVFSSSKLNEVQKYLTLWDYVRDTTMWVMNKDRLAGLDDASRTIVTECAAQALAWSNHYLDQNESRIIAELEASGTVVTRLSADEQAAFAAMSKGLYAQYVDRIGQGVFDLFETAAK